MSSDEKAADGWVAWHPKSGVTIACLSKTACEHKLSGVKHENFQRYEEFSIAHETELNKALNDGWRIRPVRLQFLDEPQESVDIIEARNIASRMLQPTISEWKAKVADLEKQLQGDGWIKCSERLPTTDKRGVPPYSILAYGVNPERYHFWKEKGTPFVAFPERFIACYVPQYGFLKNGFYFKGELDKEFVTHWMPLPDAPHTGKEEK